MHVVFSCENTQYMWWQAELLQHTYMKVGMQSKLTALVSTTGEPPRDFTCSSMEVSNYKSCGVTGIFKPFNKPGSIAEWTAAAGPQEDTVFIIDPDSAFVGIVADPGPLPLGEACAQSYDYMDISLSMSQTVVNRHCRHEARDRVQPVGIYIMINKSDLAQLAPRWLQKTIEIRDDDICRNALPYEAWISDMWAYAIVAAELGIRHRITNFSQMTGSNSLAYPIIHYCFPVLAEPDQWWDPGRNQTKVWSKWDYEPWNLPPACVAGTVEGRALLDNLTELAAARNQHIFQTDEPPLSAG
jgi:hypothetical protein